MVAAFASFAGKPARRPFWTMTETTKASPPMPPIRPAGASERTRVESVEDAVVVVVMDVPLGFVEHI